MKKTRSANAYVCGFFFEILISLIVFGDIWDAGADFFLHTSLVWCRVESGLLRYISMKLNEVSRVLNATYLIRSVIWHGMQ